MCLSKPKLCLNNIWRYNYYLTEELQPIPREGSHIKYTLSCHLFIYYLAR